MYLLYARKQTGKETTCTVGCSPEHWPSNCVRSWTTSLTWRHTWQRHHQLCGNTAWWYCGTWQHQRNTADAAHGARQRNFARSLPHSALWRQSARFISNAHIQWHLTCTCTCIATCIHEQWLQQLVLQRHRWTCDVCMTSRRCLTSPGQQCPTAVALLNDCSRACSLLESQHLRAQKTIGCAKYIASLRRNKD